MLTIYVSFSDQRIITADGETMTVKCAFVRTPEGLVDFRSFQLPPGLDAMKIVLFRRILRWRARLPKNLQEAILYFLHHFHSRQDISFDCYAFANLIAGMAEHSIQEMPRYWDITPLPKRIKKGSVVFLLSGEDQFHHAAVYIGSGLYLSVWGAGGDLEFATLGSMEREFGASEIVLARPLDPFHT